MSWSEATLGTSLAMAGISALSALELRRLANIIPIGMSLAVSVLKIRLKVVGSEVAPSTTCPPSLAFRVGPAPVLPPHAARSSRPPAGNAARAARRPSAG